MVQIIEENRRPERVRPPSMTDRFKNAFATGVQVAGDTWIKENDKRLREEKESKLRESVSQLTGLNVDNFTPEMLADIVKSYSQEQFKPAKPKSSNDIDYKQAVNRATAKMLSGEALTKEEEDLIPPSIQVQNKRLNNPSKTASSYQEVPKEVSNRIETILAENPNASPDELRLKMDKAGIPPSYSNSYIENRRREQEEKNKKTEANAERDYREKVRFHEESQKYDEGILESYKRSANQLNAIEDISKSIKSGNVKPGKWSNILSSFGDVGKKISNAMINEDQAVLNASVPYLLEGWKDVFGVRLSDADLEILKEKLPDIGKSPESNEAILKVMRKYAELSSLKYEIAKDIKKQHGKYRPAGYQDLVEEEYESWTRPVRMISPNGKEILVPAFKVNTALKKGAKVANERL